jgi:short subunit dehydrogenase-like uncharacterized protein
MGVVNERVVRRSNALLGYPYGRDFSYNERMRFPSGARGLMMATAVSAGIATLTAALVFPPTRGIVDRLAPSSGEGPSQEARESGFFRLRLEGSSMAVRVEGDQDPGYGSTSKMLAESALCLALDEPRGPVLRGGLLTPASSMGVALLERLQRAGILFEVE